MQTKRLADDERRLLQEIIEIVRGNSIPDVLVSCTEAGRLIGRTPATISQMIRDGRLHKATIGSSTGIRLSEIREKCLI